MATSHRECDHAATPELRRACRMVREFIALAEKHDLVAERCDKGESRYVVWGQWWIKNPRRDWNTSILITASRNTPSFTVCPVGGEHKRVSLREARIWLGIINI